MKIFVCYILFINFLFEEKLKYKFFRFYFENKDFLILISMRFDVLFEVVGFFEVFLIEVIFVGSVYIVCFF